MDNIYVTKPFLPPLEEFKPYLEQIWDNKWLTNNGPFHEEFEKSLAKYLNVKYLSLCSNGTLALILALKALRITGEVITTPYSFVATTHALWWNSIDPVFVDINEADFNINPDKIEAAITPKTTAILAVHVYGHPCDHKAIQQIADTYNLKVIYDAAHAFGVKQNNQSILNFGDLSVLSFHATKVFNTFEGGAIICHDEKMKKHIDDLKNFGFRDEVTVVAPGMNAKMNEFQAALGLLQLKYFEENITKREKISEIYRKELTSLQGITIIPEALDTSWNYAYFPVLINKKQFGKSRDEVYYNLRQNGIYARRYFYPLISSFPSYRRLESAKDSNHPMAVKKAEEILCLPIYPELELNQVAKIIEMIVK